MEKLYHSISEVSNLLGLKQYVLRYWETEFPNIKPDKNRAGNRVYKEKDINNFKIVQTLLHDKKKMFLVLGCSVATDSPILAFYAL